MSHNLSYIQISTTDRIQPEVGCIHHSQILQHWLNGVQSSVFSLRIHHSNPEPNRYIYHSDHASTSLSTSLGSSAFLTDASGDPTQHLQYLPFGENFIEQRTTTNYYSPYTFLAKEKDMETGYSYFGARYYDADISVWLSVDPMSDKYPSMSAYMYCAGNPVILVDPDGMKIINEYEKYKEYPSIRKQLRNNIKNATTSIERDNAKNELRDYRKENRKGYRNYKRVNYLLTGFKRINESEYDKINNLTFNGVEIDVIVGLSDLIKGSDGQYGETEIEYTPDKIFMITDLSTNEFYKLPTKIEDNQISITLFGYGQTLSTLANEFGDALFSVENPRAVYSDLILETPYREQSSYDFSRKYERYIINRHKKPNPEDY